MVVNYYSVKNCKYEVYENRPALFPPDNTEESLLREYGFVKMIDGRWCKFLSGTEYQRIIKMYPCDVTIDKSYNSLKYTSMKDKEKNRISNILSVFSLVCFAVGIGPILEMMFTPVVVFWGFAISLVIAARVKSPKNVFAKILSIFYIIVGIAIIIFITIFIAACQYMRDSCINNPNNCHIPG